METPALRLRLAASIALVVAASTARANGLAQEKTPAQDAAKESRQNEVNSWAEIPEGYSFVHRDPLRDKLSPTRFWTSAPEDWRFAANEMDDGLGQTVQDAGPALTLASKAGYEPRVRSPRSIALIPDIRVEGDFVLEVEMMQTGADTPHRDLCLIFGFEALDRFYYAHLGLEPDEHSCNVFRVDSADRERVGTVAKRGMAWGRGTWHRVRLECSQDGSMRLFFDNMETPQFDVKLDRAASGLLGFGSFDDSGAFRNLRIWGQHAKRAAWMHNPFGEQTPVTLTPPDDPARVPSFVDRGEACQYVTGELKAGKGRFDLVVVDRNRDGEFGGSGDAWTIADAGYFRSQRGRELDCTALIAWDGSVTLKEGVRVAVSSIERTKNAAKGAPADLDSTTVLAVLTPSSQTRSESLATLYARASGMKETEALLRPWTWTTDLAAARADSLRLKRPLLLALTPAGDVTAAHWDRSVFGDENVLKRLDRDFLCVRVDPRRVAGPVVRWSGDLSKPSGGARVVLSGTDGVLDVPVDAVSFLSWLDSVAR